MAATDRVGMRIISDPDKTRVDTDPSGKAARALDDHPLRLILISNLGRRKAPVWSDGSHLVGVDRYTVDDFMRSMSPGVSIAVPNRINDREEHLEVEVTFERLSDFRPEAIAASIRVLRPLVAVRMVVEEALSGKIPPEDLSQHLIDKGVDEEWSEQLSATLVRKPAPGKSSDQKRTSASSLDRLFELVDSGSDGESDGDSLVDAVIGALTEPAGPSLDREVAQNLIVELRDLIATQVEEVVSHPSFRQLERAWRGLHFLVKRIDPRRNIILDVLPANRSELAEAIYHQVLLPEHTSNGKGVGVSALVIDYEFDGSAADLAMLEDLGETGQSLQAPVIGSLAPEFFGIKGAAGLSRLPLFGQHLSRPEYARYRG
ncbi:MAG: type VI secretion system contractile sheath domain-containing protein, partial [Rhodothermales bacterium]